MSEIKSLKAQIAKLKEIQQRDLECLVSTLRELDRVKAKNEKLEMEIKDFKAIKSEDFEGMK